jgi:hypothetical protein
MFDILTYKFNKFIFKLLCESLPLDAVTIARRMHRLVGDHRKKVKCHFRLWNVTEGEAGETYEYNPS